MAGRRQRHPDRDKAVRRAAFGAVAVCLLALAPLRLDAQSHFGLREPPPDVLAEPYIATADNTLHDIAVVFDMGFVELLAANPGIDPWTPGEGTRVQIPTRHLLPDGIRKGIIVNIGDQRAYHFKDDGEVESFPIGVGREGRSIPLGKTSITRKRENPTWRPTKSILAEKPHLPAVVPPGPDNPLGDYALNLGFPAYLLHGTNMPDGVGRRVSSGCIRLYPWHIEHLFQQVKVGTPVEVVDQPVKVEEIDGALYLEVHPSGRELDEIEEAGSFTPQPIAGLEQMVTEKAGDLVHLVDWERVAEASINRTGLPVRITSPYGGAYSAVGDNAVQETLTIPEIRSDPLDEVQPNTSPPGEARGPVSLTEHPSLPRPLETGRERMEEPREPGAGIW